MYDHPNALLLKQAWQAVADGDADMLAELWSEDVVWHVTAENPWQGDHVGHEAIIDYLAQVGEAGEAYDTSLEELMVGDNHAAMLCRVHAKRGNRVLDVGQVLLGRFENGRIAEVWTLSLDPAAMRRFWKAD